MKQRKQHLENLNAIFPQAIDGYFEKLQCLEKRACKFNEDHCNGLIDSESDWEKQSQAFKLELNEILRPGSPAILYVNGDPRGYSLKIETEERQRLFREEKINIWGDWGGYGILCPQFEDESEGDS
jgi:hypothetical protein|tara:strand:- start:143 stop:520 length:378 start_codon:yes stop_codon:yes gene_type:complete